MSDPFFNLKTMFPNKIYALDLSTSEILVFIILISHGGKKSFGIFPSTDRISQLAAISRRQVSRCLNTLAECNVIQWDRGRQGVSNHYTILGEGAWNKKKKGLRSSAIQSHVGGTYSPMGRDIQSYPGGTVCPTNHSNFNQINELKGHEENLRLKEKEEKKNEKIGFDTLMGVLNVMNQQNKKEDVSWKESQTLEDWIKQAITHGHEDQVVPLLKALPEELRIKYRKLWLEMKQKKD